MATKKKIDILAYTDMIGALKSELTPIEDLLVSYMFWNLEKTKVIQAIEFLTNDTFCSEYARAVFESLKLSITENIEPMVSMVKNQTEFIAKLNESKFNSDFINVDSQIDHIVEVNNKIIAAEMMQQVLQGKTSLDSMVSQLLFSANKLEKTNQQLADEFFIKNATISTGFKKLDDITGGIGAGHLWLVSGYTSAGKTMFLVSLLHNLLLQEHNCLFFSLEMTNKDIFGRLVAKDSGVNVRKVINNPSLPEADIVRKSIARLKDKKFMVFQAKRGLDEILIEIKKQSIKEKVDCVFIDYAQLISVSAVFRSEYDSMTRAAQKIQDFCKSTNIPVILLSQISNESAKSPDDKMISAKGGGSLPASADMAIELYSEMTADEISEANHSGGAYQVTCRVKKNRHGRTGKVDMSAFAWKSTFEESADAPLVNVPKPLDW